MTLRGEKIQLCFTSLVSTEEGKFEPERWGTGQRDSVRGRESQSRLVEFIKFSLKDITITKFKGKQSCVSDTIFNRIKNHSFMTTGLTLQTTPRQVYRLGSVSIFI